MALNAASQRSVWTGRVNGGIDVGRLRTLARVTFRTSNEGLF